MTKEPSGWSAALLLATFAFMNALCWASIIPIGDAPDEPGHFEVVAFEAVFGRIPEVGVDDYGAQARIAIDDYRTPVYSYSAQPGLSYIVSAVAVRVLSGLDVEAARVARFPGAVWAALMTVTVFAGVRVMFRSEPGVAVLAATVVTCWPQLVFVFSYTNNDGLTALVCSALIAVWFRGRDAGWRDRDVAWLGVFSGLVLLNKPNGFPLVALAGLGLLWDLAKRRGERVKKTSIALAGGLLAGGWWYAIAFHRYGWDLLATGRADSLRHQLGVEWASGRYYGMNPFETAFNRFPRFGETWIAGTLRTAVGAFGELTIALPRWSYVIIAVLTGLSVVGLALVWWRNRGRRMTGDAEGIQYVTFLLVPAFLGLALYRSWAFDFQAQGRYLFPAMLPFAAMVSFGLLGPLRGLGRAIAGFMITLALFVVMLDGFLVRLVGAYRLAYGDLFERGPGLSALWVVSLTLAMAAITLYWMRMAKCADTPVRPGDLGGPSSE